VSEAASRGPVRILVVDDTPMNVKLLEGVLSGHGYAVSTAPSGPVALERVREDRPDLVLLDVVMPEMSGYEVCRRLRADEATRLLPVIMVTALDPSTERVKGIEAGADDYLTKPFSPKELAARIKAVLRRRAPQLADDVVEIGGLRLDPAARRVTAGGKIIELAPTEFRLLHFFMTHPERIYSRAQVLDYVWGDHVFIEERTVDVHIRRLRKALEPSGHDRFVDTVRGSGYGFRKP
jgi:two-component system phosphate regulon response regulator PhoB